MLSRHLLEPSEEEEEEKDSSDLFTLYTWPRSSSNAAVAVPRWFSGLGASHAVFPSLFRWPERAGVMVGMDEKDSFSCYASASPEEHRKNKFGRRLLGNVGVFSALLGLTAVFRPCVSLGRQLEEFQRFLRKGGHGIDRGEDFSEMLRFSAQCLVRQRIHAHVSEYGGSREFHLFSSTTMVAGTRLVLLVTTLITPTASRVLAPGLFLRRLVYGSHLFDVLPEFKYSDFSGRSLPETFPCSALFGLTVDTGFCQSTEAPLGYSLCFATETDTHSALDSAENCASSAVAVR